VNGSASAALRFVIPLGMFLREYYRNPLNVVLLFVIPALLVLSFGDSVNRIAAVLQQPSTRAMGQSLGALWAAAFLTGITGFFMMVDARAADRRLVRAGYSPLEVVGQRFVAVSLLGAIATAVSYSVLLTQVTPVNQLQALSVMYAASLIYGALGILIGSILAGELEGSFALLFFFIMDAFIGTPLFGTTSDAFVLLPTYFPSKILLSLTAEQPHATIHWLYVGTYLVSTAGLACWAFYRVARVK
jgi:ABC-2 type transport system permease protein